mmetsp:Transcript_24683/g.68267  ORF Transcript_24683/g.68267 Transcript_24683/m.68267 type:complete len:257 (+) Transcript_24683:82-852(+)
MKPINLFLCLALATVEFTSAFAVQTAKPKWGTKLTHDFNSIRVLVVHRSASDSEWEAEDGLDTISEPDATNIEKFLKQKFPEFLYLISKNDEILQDVIRNPAKINEGVTIFAPNSAAFQKLGSVALRQLDDERNEEISQKIASYHVVTDGAVDYRKLRTEDWTKGRPKDGSKPAFTVEGVQTMGGIVPVGRAKEDGLFGTGWFAKEGEDPVVGSNAKIVASYVVGGSSVIHEMDGFISPELLWRYADQLQIKLPGL